MPRKKKTSEESHLDFVVKVQQDEGFVKWLDKVSPRQSGIQKVWIAELFEILRLLYEIYKIIAGANFIASWWYTGRAARAIAGPGSQAGKLEALRRLKADVTPEQTAGTWWVLFIALVFSLCSSAGATSLQEEIFGDGVYTVAQKNEAEKKREAIKKAWEKGRLKKVAYDVDRGMGQLFKIAVLNLRKRGYHTDADWMNAEWKKLQGTLPRIVESDGRKIGDWEPLSLFISVAFDKLESLLGYELCRTLHLDSLKTFNYCIPVVVLRACQYGEQEFFYHFVHDDPMIFHPYKGLAPVTAYWIASISCSIGTFGGGLILYPICGAVSGLVELSVDKWVAPWLSPKLYSWACSK